MVPLIISVTPIVGLSFPALIPIAMATAGALGYKAMLDLEDGGDINEALRERLRESTTVPVRVDDLVLDAMQAEVARAQSLHFNREGLTLALIRDERGKLRIEISGPKNADRRELEAAGRDFAEELARAYAYNRAVQEAERLGAEAIEESINDEGEVVLRFRRMT